MWRILGAFHLPYSQTLPYDCCPDSLDENEEVLPLDPIDPNLVGGVHLHLIQASARVHVLTFALEAISILIDPTTIRELVTDPIKLKRTSRNRFTNSAYRDHLRDLTRWGVTQAGGSVRFVSRYFAIPKTESVARSIFNGRLLSRFFAVPGPVNLPYIPIILRLVMDLIATFGRLYSTCADIRHWFHQLEVGEHLREYFGVALSDTETFRWCVLPMGWSHSPRICQSIAWAAILHKDPRCKDPDPLDDARKEIRGLNDPPQYVRMTVNGVVVGFITLTYDNIGIFSADHDAYLKVNSRIRANFKHFNIIEKE